MITPIAGLLSVLGLITAVFVAGLGRAFLLARRRPESAIDPAMDARLPSPIHFGIGAVTNFFDTLGIGSFASTTALFRLGRIVNDRIIPGTLNVGHTLPTVVQTFIYTTLIKVDILTLFSMIASAILGAWLGAGVVARWPKRMVQIGMGCALLVAAGLLLMQALKLGPWTPEPPKVAPAVSSAVWAWAGPRSTVADGSLALWLTRSPITVPDDPVGVRGERLAIAIGVNFALGALMTLGIGLYAPCMILVSLLGMNPKVAFPVMMGSCAFLMPVGSLRFIRERSFDLRASLGLALGGIPAVLVAAFIVKEMPLSMVRWLVIGVVVITSGSMLWSAFTEKPTEPASPASSLDPR